MGNITRRKALKLLNHSITAGVFVLTLPTPVFQLENVLNIPVRGIYVPGWKGVNKFRIDTLIDFLVNNNLNTLMIDVKNAHGVLFYKPTSDLAIRIGAQVKTKEGHARSLVMDYLIQKSKEYGIRLIARHVMFVDKVLYENIPDARLTSGHGQYWVDMENEKVVNYNLDLVAEEMKLGFDEIVLDYIRYPDKPGFGREDNRCDTMDGVVKSAKGVLKNAGVQLGLQVFGYSAWSNYFTNVGQRIETLQLYADIIYPMLYPSHFFKNTMGFKDPNEQPFEIIKRGYKAAILKIDTDCKIIPMIQGFSYSPEKIAEQIIAVKKQNMPGFICWNPSGNHSKLIQAIKIL